MKKDAGSSTTVWAFSATDQNALTINLPFGTGIAQAAEANFTLDISL
jgi:hypothetical protein